MEILLVVIHLIACISIVALVLIQQGKGSDIGAAFGGGASGTVFGSPGSSSFLLKITSLAAAVFFATCLGIGYLSSQNIKAQDSLQVIPPVNGSQQTTPSDNNTTTPVPTGNSTSQQFAIPQQNQQAPVESTTDSTTKNNSLPNLSGDE
jgi:preprotein translocase subunit SecG